ncbi:anti-sigma regulatory factor [cf. Phormidesmis sp. LEGE 11477]|uniref:ATP-binding protein n=1 Tax=cf. Phormidesmis sp. LEGE 11477 TaxID=1828680 RepID=UPI0018819A0E|nr:anti-sigma regulatory factor [cf. Phormidesmis sp. LEGE 11477]MBE9060640.1 anti-sigma regulatory factor [cf. Phormidesmis sp. LEGE 11477]
MSEKAHLTVGSYLEELTVVQQWFRSIVSRLSAEAPWINGQYDKLNLALAEGFTNAVRHAHADLPSTTPISIELVLQADKIEIFIFDQGRPFDPDSIREPKPGVLREGGYGWFLLRRLADQVTYSPIANQSASLSLPANSPWRNCLRIVKSCAS